MLIAATTSLHNGNRHKTDGQQQRQLVMYTVCVIVLKKQVITFTQSRTLVYVCFSRAGCLRSLCVIYRNEKQDNIE